MQKTSSVLEMETSKRIININNNKRMTEHFGTQKAEEGQGPTHPKTVGMIERSKGPPPSPKALDLTFRPSNKSATININTLSCRNDIHKIIHTEHCHLAPLPPSDTTVWSY